MTEWPWPKNELLAAESTARCLKLDRARADSAGSDRIDMIGYPRIPFCIALKTRIICVISQGI